MREQLALLLLSALVGGAGAQVTALWRRERAIRLGVLVDSEVCLPLRNMRFPVGWDRDIASDILQFFH